MCAIPLGTASVLCLCLLGASVAFLDRDRHGSSDAEPPRTGLRRRPLACALRSSLPVTPEKRWLFGICLPLSCGGT